MGHFFFRLYIFGLDLCHPFKVAETSYVFLALIKYYQSLARFVCGFSDIVYLYFIIFLRNFSLINQISFLSRSVLIS